MGAVLAVARTAARDGDAALVRLVAGLALVRLGVARAVLVVAVRAALGVRAAAAAGLALRLTAVDVLELRRLVAGLEVVRPARLARRRVGRGAVLLLPVRGGGVRSPRRRRGLLGARFLLRPLLRLGRSGQGAS